MTLLADLLRWSPFFASLYAIAETENRWAMLVFAAVGLCLLGVVMRREALRAADDLQHADVRDARRLRYRSQADALGMSLPNGDAPLLLGSGASLRGPLHASEHLRDLRKDRPDLAQALHVGAADDPCAVRGVAVRPSVDQRLAHGPALCEQLAARETADVLLKGGRNLHRALLSVGLHAVRIVTGGSLVKA